MNLRSITPAALLLATTLALAGCGTPSAAGGSSSPASGESLAASPSATPTPTPTPTPKAYAEKELAAIIAGLKDAAGQPLTAVPASELDQGIESAGEMMDAAKITPAECGALADSSAQIPEGSTYAAGGSESAKEETITVLTLVAVTDPELLSSNVEASETNSTKCAKLHAGVPGPENHEHDESPGRENNRGQLVQLPLHSDAALRAGRDDSHGHGIEGNAVGLRPS